MKWWLWCPPCDCSVFPLFLRIQISYELSTSSNQLYHRYYMQPSLLINYHLHKNMRFNKTDVFWVWFISYWILVLRSTFWIWEEEKRMVFSSTQLYGNWTHAHLFFSYERLSTINEILQTLDMAIITKVLVRTFMNKGFFAKSNIKSYQVFPFLVWRTSMLRKATKCAML